MRSDRHPGRRLAATAALLALLALVLPALAGAEGSRTRAPFAADAHASGALSDRAMAARVAAYWTPERMAAARPLDLVVGRDGEPRVRVGTPELADAVASFVRIKTPEVLPYAVNGRIFIKRGKLNGFCSGTAINTPTRQLVLTAGHCVNSGPEDGKKAVWSDWLEFVPAYDGDVAPFGAFVAQRDQIFAPRAWTKQGNPDFDLGAFLTHPNAEGTNLADAVGGGATIVMDLPRGQNFSTFGYPGETKRMKGCRSPYIGDDTLTYPFPGPPTMAIRCRWAPGASGGGWLLGEGTEINGVNSYLHVEDKSRTFGPYFAKETVGKLVRGL